MLLHAEVIPSGVGLSCSVNPYSDAGDRGVREDRGEVDRAFAHIRERPVGGAVLQVQQLEPAG